MNFIAGYIRKQGEYSFLDESGQCKITLGRDIPEALKHYIDKPVQLGVRPENIHIHEEDSPSENYDCTLKVIAHENMGNEQLVYLSLAGQTLIVRRAPRETVDFGQAKHVSFMKDKLIYIDEATGDVISG